MNILLINHERQYLEVLHLTPYEEEYLNNYDDFDSNETEKVEHILRARNIEVGTFNPTWMVYESALPVFDDCQDMPVTTLQ